MPRVATHNKVYYLMGPRDNLADFLMQASFGAGESLSLSLTIATITLEALGVERMVRVDDATWTTPRCSRVRTVLSPFGT